MALVFYISFLVNKKIDNIDKKYGIVHEHVLYCMYTFLIWKKSQILW